MADAVGSGEADPSGPSEGVSSGDPDGDVAGGDPGLVAEGGALRLGEPDGDPGDTGGEATDEPQPSTPSATTIATVHRRKNGRGGPDTHARAGFTP